LQLRLQSFILCLPIFTQGSQTAARLPGDTSEPSSHSRTFQPLMIKDIGVVEILSTLGSTKTVASPAKRLSGIGVVGLVRGVAWFGAVLCGLLVALPAVAATGDAPGEFIPATPPQPAPQTAFTDTDGKPLTLADFKGKPAVVNLWATWCQPCLKEMPSLDRLQANLDGKLTVAAVSQDRSGAQRVVPFVANMGLQKLKIYLDPKADLGRALNSRGLPTSVIIDAAGSVIGRVEGAVEWDSAEIMALLRPLLVNGAVGGALKASGR
jgi:thiol-disulfide isomerase/thioredoxin